MGSIIRIVVKCIKNRASTEKIYMTRGTKIAFINVSIKSFHLKLWDIFCFCFSGSSCDSEDVKSFKMFLFQFFQTTTTAARLDKVSLVDNKILNENTDQSREIFSFAEFSEKNNTPSSEQDSFVKTHLDFNKLNDSELENELYPDVITNDVKGNDIKSLFRFLDLDEDGLVGSEEAYEVKKCLIESLKFV